MLRTGWLEQSIKENNPPLPMLSLHCTLPKQSPSKVGTALTKREGTERKRVARETGQTCGGSPQVILFGSQRFCHRLWMNIRNTDECLSRCSGGLCGLHATGIVRKGSEGRCLSGHMALGSVQPPKARPLPSVMAP